MVVVNLGIGIHPVANYIPDGMEVEFQSENSILGMGPFPLEGDEDADSSTPESKPSRPCRARSTLTAPHLPDPRPTRPTHGARRHGGNPNGDIANWKIPGKMVKGMGGATDLVASAGTSSR